MAVTLLAGQVSWSVEQDEDGHREYVAIFKVMADREDGPYDVLNCPGLPEEGQAWNLDNDVDPLAWCKFNRKATPMVTGEANETWLVECHFSTRAVDKCREEPQLDPLQEPYKWSGGTTKYTEEGTADKDGYAILNSAFEVIRGPQNEWDASRGTVKVTQNVADLELAVLDALIDHVNESTMWGLRKRKIKFSHYTWEQKFHGMCDEYFTRTLEFEIRREGFDRSLLDESNKVLMGHWQADQDLWINDDINGVPPNFLNPAHFKRAIDRAGNPIRIVLDGAGNPFNPNLTEEVKYWCVDNGVDFLVKHLTCSQVRELAWYHGAYVKGPYDNQLDAEEVCSEEADEVPETGEDLLEDPNDLACQSDPIEPPKLRIKKYLEADLLTRLDLGADFLSLGGP